MLLLRLWNSWSECEHSKEILFPCKYNLLKSKESSRQNVRYFTLIYTYSNEKKYFIKRSFEEKFRNSVKISKSETRYKIFENLLHLKKIISTKLCFLLTICHMSTRIVFLLVFIFIFASIPECDLRTSILIISLTRSLFKL